MAKKRRQKTEKKEEYDIKLPEFDEHEYIALELRKSKVSFMGFIYALLIVVITYFIYHVTYPDWRIPIVIGLFGVLGIPLLVNKLKIDTTGFDWKNWVGSGAIYIMSWLAIFILVCNPPFSDFAEPEIDEESVNFSFIKSQDNPNNWIDWNTSNTPPDIKSQTEISKIRVRVKITDNDEVDKDSVKLTIDPVIFNNGTNTIFGMNNLKQNIYEVVLEPSDAGQAFKNGNFNYFIEAKDINGHKKEIQGKFKILMVQT